MGIQVHHIHTPETHAEYNERLSRSDETSTYISDLPSQHGHFAKWNHQFENIYYWLLCVVYVHVHRSISMHWHGSSTIRFELSSWADRPTDACFQSIWAQNASSSLKISVENIIRKITTLQCIRNCNCITNWNWVYLMGVFRAHERADQFHHNCIRTPLKWIFFSLQYLCSAVGRKIFLSIFNSYEFSYQNANANGKTNWKQQPANNNNNNKIAH